MNYQATDFSVQLSSGAHPIKGNQEGARCQRRGNEVDKVRVLVKNLTTKQKEGKKEGRERK